MYFFPYFPLIKGFLLNECLNQEWSSSEILFTTTIYGGALLKQTFRISAFPICNVDIATLPYLNLTVDAQDPLQSMDHISLIIMFSKPSNSWHIVYG